MLALSTPAVGGPAALAGTPGWGVTATVVMVFGHPSSVGLGARDAAGARRAIGQWLPPAAGTTLPCSVSCLGGAAATGPAQTPGWWVALVLGGVLGARAGKDAARADERDREAVA
ncbi:hypothetical protein AB0M97_15815 [Streptomyces sp. NPDC051207]|uniref:hypothetical protein n=1 Tax=Streptomyces sp. NPDC051207 TaxID=3154641 RepID=UPI003413CD18